MTSSTTSSTSTSSCDSVSIDTCLPTNCFSGAQLHSSSSNERRGYTNPEQNKLTPGNDCHRVISRDRKEKREKSKRRKFFIFVIVLFCFNLLCSIGIVFLILKFSNFLSTKECIPCGKILDGSGKMLGHEGVTMSCCRDSDSDLQTIFEETVKSEVQSQVQETFLKQLNNNNLPYSINKRAAHVYLRDSIRRGRNNNKKSKEYNLEDNVVTIKNWNDQGNTAFIREDIGYSNRTGVFTIKVAGVYVIYSRLVFDKPIQSTHGNSILFHQVIKGGSHSMLEDSQMSACEGDDEDVPCHSSFLYSTLYLRKDLELEVMAKPEVLLRNRDQASYFGLYKID